ncbi:TIGR03915 family putative DNA repair protein [Desulforamulus putei]|uniref:TIGR03915 family putative DNA repair protein n=1 Tax=Desulforamulus putei TaxID=74701 RepID=UPI002FDD477A
MIYYLYDGTFEGLLTAIYEAYYRREKPAFIMRAEEYEANLFSRPVIIITDSEKSDKVYRSIEDKISRQALRHVYYAYLSDIKGVATLIYRYLQLGWQVGAELDSQLFREPVREMLAIYQRVSKERHRMLGLLRFCKLTGEIYFATCEPDHNIVGLVAPHFARRLADQNWVIYDQKRGLAAVYNQREWFITNLNLSGQLLYEENEKIYQQLWKQYFAGTAIQDRLNPKLQRQFMPVRYWKHLVEKN